MKILVIPPIPAPKIPPPTKPNAALSVSENKASPELSSPSGYPNIASETSPIIAPFATLLPVEHLVFIAPILLKGISIAFPFEYKSIDVFAIDFILPYLFFHLVSHRFE